MIEEDFDLTEHLSPRHQAAEAVLSGHMGLREAAREHGLDSGNLSRFIAGIKSEHRQRKIRAEAEARFYDWVENTI